MGESKILADIKRELNLDGRVRLFRNSVGFDLDRKIRFGLGKGSPDLVGVLRDGRAFCLEVKSAGGRERPEQVSWWKFARQWGVLGGVVRSVDEAMKMLDEATIAKNSR